MKNQCLRILFICSIFLLAANLADAQHTHTGDHEEPGHHEGLHFVHPLFTESVSPDTKLRLDYGLHYPGPTAEAELEGEYALSRIFSLEAGVHVDPGEAALGSTHLLFKFANYALEDEGILLGYGLSLDLPTGSGGGHAHGGEGEGGHGPADHHHDENIYRFSPFFNVGFMAGNLEVVGWSLFNIPTNQAHPEDASTSLTYNFSALYHLTSRLQPLLELNGKSRLSGAGERKRLQLSPGLRVQVFRETPLVLGAGVQLPLTGEEEMDSRLQFSAFYHF